MRFINKGEPTQVRIKENSGFRWESVKTNEVIDLPEDMGFANGFKPLITEGKIGTTKVETKQIELIDELNKEDFYTELVKIKGIGKYTAKDLVLMFTRDSLIDAIKNNKPIPIRNDIEKILRREYGKR